MTLPRLFRSLRARLIALTVVVQVITMSAVVFNSERLLEKHLVHQFELRRAELTSLLHAAIGPSMAQRDYAAVSETLRSARELPGISYLVVFDEAGQSVAHINWERSVPLPAANSEDERLSDLHILHTRIPIVLEGQPYGELQIGIDLGSLREVRETLPLQNLLLTGLGILLSALFLGMLAHRLTRRLDHLSEASRKFGAGRAFTALPGTGDDDLGQVISAFNGMAISLEQRMADLQGLRAALLHRLELACPLRPDLQDANAGPC